MTRRKVVNNVPEGIDPAALDELLSSGGRGAEFDFDGLEFVAYGRLAVAVARLGGMVTTYRSGADNAMCLSIRVGERKRSYQFDTAEQWNEWLEQIANAWEQLAAKAVRVELNGAGQPSDTVKTGKRGRPPTMP